MKENNTFQIASIYIGTLIGAGFASGQEVICFFTKYGEKGIYGVLLTTILLSVIGIYILLQVYKYRVESYHDFIKGIFGVYTGKIIELFLNILLLSFYCVMIAGSGALFESYFGYSKEMGIIFLSVMCCLTFIFSIKGLAFMNSIVVPLLIIGIIVIGCFVIFEEMPLEYDADLYEVHGNWLVSSLLYISYNSICGIMVLSSLYPLIKNKKVAVAGGCLGGIGLGCMLLFLFLSTSALYTGIKDTEIPMMGAALKLGENIGFIYGVLLWCAMFTTAISNGFVFIQSIEKKLRINHIFVCVMYCIITMPLATFGFKNLVRMLYPLFGGVGAFIILITLFKRKNNH